MDYLKNMEFGVDDGGLWTIESSEELAAYDPSKIQFTIFKFDKDEYQYKMDTNYLHYDKDVE